MESVQFIFVEWRSEWKNCYCLDREWLVGGPLGGEVGTVVVPYWINNSNLISRSCYFSSGNMSMSLDLSLLHAAGNVKHFLPLP